MKMGLVVLNSSSHDYDKSTHFDKTKKFMHSYYDYGKLSCE